MALILGALVMHDIQPGPNVITTNPTLFWGLIASMWIGNLMLVLLNLPLVSIWVKMLSVPYKYIFPGILMSAAEGRQRSAAFGAGRHDDRGTGGGPRSFDRSHVRTLR